MCMMKNVRYHSGVFIVCEACGNLSVDGFCPVNLSLHCIDYVVEQTPPAQSRRVLNSASIFGSSLGHMKLSSV